MSFTNRISLCAASAVLCATSASSASIVQLTFEGLQDNEQVGGFYNGGAGGFGSIGSQNLGFTFSGNARALIDADQGGTGNFGNEPSPSTVMFFTGGSAITINRSAGFQGVYGYYASFSQAASWAVYSGINGTGDLLASGSLVSTGAGNGDPSGGNYAEWRSFGQFLSAGTDGRSLVLTGVANEIAFDNLTFTVPAPGALALLGVAGLAGSRRRR
jgi:hypothetical protein